MRNRALGQRVNDLQAKVAAARASGVGVSDAEAAYSRNLAKLAGIYDVMSQVAPQNAEVLAKGVFSNTTTDVHGRTATIQEIIDANRSDADLQKMRREYASQAAIQNQQNANAQAIAGGGPLGGLPNVGGP